MCQNVEWLTFWSGEGRHLAAQALERARAGGVGTFEGFCLTAKGTPKWWAVTITPVLREQGKVDQLLAISRDITARKQAEVALAELLRLAQLSIDVSTALTERASLHQVLTNCAQALVTHLDAAFARIWTLNEATQILELQASAGQYTHLNGAHSRILVGSLKIGLIAQSREPHLTNTVIGDPRIADHQWAIREGMVSFAGYPLIVGERLVGVMALFARHLLTPQTLDAMKAVARGIAMGIERKWLEVEQQHLLDMVTLEHTRFESLLHHLPSGVIMAEAPSGKIVLGNQQSEHILRHPILYAESVQDYGAWTGWHIDGSPVQLEEWPLARAVRGEFCSEDIRYQRGDGSICFIRFHGAPLKDLDGKVIAGIVTFNDITEQKELERRQEAFLSLATHELKTPLTSLQGNIQLAQRRIRRLDNTPAQVDAGQPKIIEEVQTLLLRCQQQLRLQNRLISDLLDMSRLHTDKWDLHLQTLDLVSLVTEVVQEQQVANPKRAILLELPEQEPLLVEADRDRVEQVVTNYLTNALRYSPIDQPVFVGLTLQAKQVRVWIRDRGPGLSEEAQKRIWQQFYQVPTIQVQGGPGVGLGLGLYICQNIIRGHQGQLGVESQPGQGSTFWFTLPLLQQENSDPLSE